MVALTDARTFAVEKHARMHAYTFTINTLVNLGGVQMFNSQQEFIFQCLLRYCVIAVLWRYLSLLHLEMPQQSKAKQRPLTLLRSHMKPYGPSHSIKRCNVVFISMHASTQHRTTNAASTLEKLVSSWARLHICVICGISRARSPARCTHRSKSYPERVPHTARCSARSTTMIEHNGIEHDERCPAFQCRR